MAFGLAELLADCDRRSQAADKVGVTEVRFLADHPK